MTQAQLLPTVEDMDALGDVMHAQIFTLQIAFAAHNKCRNSLTSLYACPPEILHEIFLYALDQEQGRDVLRCTRLPWAICRVCSRWRDAAHGLPALWTFVDLAKPKLARQASRLSGCLPLTFVGHQQRLGYDAISHWVATIEKVALFGSVVGRGGLDHTLSGPTLVHCVDVEGIPKDLWTFLTNLCAPDSGVQVHHFRLRHHSHDGDYPEDQGSGMRAIENLQSIELTNCPLSWRHSKALQNVTSFTYVGFDKSQTGAPQEELNNIIDTLLRIKSLMYLRLNVQVDH
jgi:hypothetical protein